MWDSATERELFVVKPPVGLDGIVFSPDGKYLAGSSWPVNDAEKTTFVYLWDAETGIAVHRFADLGEVQHCIPAFSKDGKLLAAASAETTQSLGGAHRRRGPFLARQLDVCGGLSP